ncbi:MAG TPA: DMT family transporter [Capillimicrobium sp.]|nr:DMT family transporter [Capillimicrobium sp.]
MSLRAWSCFAAVSVLWGMPYLFIKLAVDDGVSPVFLAWSRIAVGALVLLPFAWRAGLLRGLRGRWGWVALWALCETAVPFPLVAFGEQEVSSSLTAILIAAAPLMVALFALRLDPSERAGGSRLAGLVLGLAGVVALVGIDVAGDSAELLGAAAILLATAGYALAPFVLRARLEGADTIGIVAAALAMSTVALAPLAALDAPSSVPSGTAIASIVVLGVLCSAAALVLFAMLVREVGGGRAMVITYVAPIVAVALGVTVLGEGLGAGAVAGMLLILAGSWLATDGRVPPGLAAVVTRPRRPRRRQKAAGTDPAAATASG